MPLPTQVHLSSISLQLNMPIQHSHFWLEQRKGTQPTKPSRSFSIPLETTLEVYLQTKPNIHGKIYTSPLVQKKKHNFFFSRLWPRPAERPLGSLGVPARTFKFCCRMNSKSSRVALAMRLVPARCPKIPAAKILVGRFWGTKK